MTRLLLLSLVVLNCYADIDGLDLTDENSLVSSKLEDSRLIQGRVMIKDSVVEDSRIQSRSHIDDMTLTGDSQVQQSMVKVKDGSRIKGSKIRLQSMLTNADLDADSLMLQSNLIVEDSEMSGVKIKSHSVVDNLRSHDSIVNQGTIYLTGGSELKNSTALNLESRIEGVEFEEAILSQNEMRISDSVLSGSTIESHADLTSKNRRSEIDQGIVFQARHDIRQSQLSHSSIQTETYMEDTDVKNGMLDLCGIDMNRATLVGTKIKRYCSMEGSRISNGAVLYHGLMRFD